MIESFKHKGLKELFETGHTKKNNAAFHNRCLERLDILKASTSPGSMGVPGYNFHELRGKPVTYSVHVNGPWTITFQWPETSPTNVNFEKYH